MNVSFDGLRTNATRSMNTLHSVLERVLTEYKSDFYHDEDEDIYIAFNEAAMFVDSFNCLMSEADGYSHLDIDIKRFSDFEG